MGEVAVTLKIMPEDNEVDLEKIKEEIQSNFDPHSIEEEPVAFGLKALIVQIIVPEDAGTDDLEKEIKKIENVKGVDVTDQRKLL